MKKKHSFNALLITHLFLLASCLQSNVQPEVLRIDLQQHDLGIPGHEMIQKMIVFDPGSSFRKHYHPGEEIIYVAEGSIEYQLENKPPVRLDKGDVLFIPAGTAHSASNTSGARSKELATYIIQKGKALITFSNSSLPKK